jgi:hypothetical protein
MGGYLLNLTIYFYTHSTCERAKSSRVYCEELSTLRSPCRFEGRYNQRVNAVEGNQSGNKTGPSLQRIVLRSFLATVAVLGIAYGADYGVFRYRLATNHQPFGSVTVDRYYTVAHKDGRAEIIFDPSVQQTCVHSLFPHFGDRPCWYLIRHAEQRTEI